MAEKLKYKSLVKELETLEKETKIEHNPLCHALSDEEPVDIALALEELTPELATRVFATLQQPLSTEVLAKLEPELFKLILSNLPDDQMSEVVNTLPPREAAILVTEAPKKQIDRFIKNKSAESDILQEIEARVSYPKGTAGRLMTTHFLRLTMGCTVAEAIEEVRKPDPEIDLPEDIYIGKKNGNTTTCKA